MRSSWESIPFEMVKGSFISCAITTSTDGSQDEEIHCFKPGQLCQEGRGVLQEATQRISAQKSETDDDPFASVEWSVKVKQRVMTLMSNLSNLPHPCKNRYLLLMQQTLI